MRHLVVTFFALFALLLAGCESNPQGSNKTPTATPIPQAPIVSGSTTSQKALSIARVVSWGNQDMFVVADGVLSTQSMPILAFEANSGDFLGFGTLGSPQNPLVVYTMFVTTTMNEVTDSVTGPMLQTRVFEGVQRLFELSAAHLIQVSPDFNYVVVVLTYPHGQSLFFVSTRTELDAEYRKASPDWMSFFESHMWEGLNGIMRDM